MNAAIQAWIAYLRCEAAQAEERAKSLRATAAVIEANNGSADGKRIHVTAVTMLLNSDRRLLLYLQGSKRKRKRDSSKPKRAHTAYTLFVQGK
jgi:hypothetical protein